MSSRTHAKSILSVLLLGPFVLQFLFLHHESAGRDMVAFYFDLLDFFNDTNRISTLLPRASAIRLSIASECPS